MIGSSLLPVPHYKQEIISEFQVCRLQDQHERSPTEIPRNFDYTFVLYEKQRKKNTTMNAINRHGTPHS